VKVIHLGMELAKPKPSRGKVGPMTGLGFTLLITVLVLNAGFPDTNYVVYDTDSEGGEPDNSCFDTIDNDGDGMIDDQDTECQALHPDYDGIEDGV